MKISKRFSFRSPFSSFKFSLSIPYARKNIDPTTSNILNMLLENQLKGYIIENVSLDSILYTYSLHNVVEISVGEHGNEVFYVVKEPMYDKEVLAQVTRELSSRVFSDEQVISSIKTMLEKKELKPTDYVYFKVTSGLGPLTPLVLDPHVEDIHLSKSSGRIYVVHNSFSWIGWLKTNIVVKPELVDQLVLALSRRAGKHISLVQPLVEGSLEGVLRASLVYSGSIAQLGSSIVLRKKSGATHTITKLINEGTISSAVAAYLWLVIENKGWIVIAGHVGSGKTTLLQALLSLIPRNKKIITIEDSPEVYVQSELWDSFVENHEVFSRLPQVDAFALLKFALRRRADYIVIGEVRGVEARLLVQASRLGHGVLNTIHADGAQSVLERLMASPISIPKNLLGNIWTIVLTELVGKTRKVVSITEVNSDVELVEICSSFVPCSLENIAQRSVRLAKIYNSEELYQELARRAIFLEKLVSEGVFAPEALARRLFEFYAGRHVEVE
ncbi:MAG: type II/IV secretion system ATPase subunit [Desulfurococcaceae archaeon]